MIRIVCKERDNSNWAAGVAEESIVTMKTFDVDIPALEEWLGEITKMKWSAFHRMVEGIEVLP